MNALSNLRIIELGTGPTVAVTTMILADFGAEVLTIQPPRPGLLDQHPAAPMWRRGKAICPLDLDLEGDQVKFAELLASADVLVTNWRTRKLAARALDFETLSARFPHLNYCQITGFGMNGPLADLPGYEHVAAAYAGRMLQFS
ncbi:MAG: CoA transferase, partial [Pseudomonadales bacterium]